MVWLCPPELGKPPPTHTPPPPPEPPRLASSPWPPPQLQVTARASDLPDYEASPAPRPDPVSDITVQRTSGGLVKNTLAGNTSRKFDAACGDQGLNVFKNRWPTSPSRRWGVVQGPHFKNQPPGGSFQPLEGEKHINSTHLILLCF